MTKREKLFKEFKQKNPDLPDFIVNDMFAIEHGIELEDGTIAVYNKKSGGWNYTDDKGESICIVS